MSSPQHSAKGFQRGSPERNGKSGEKRSSFQRSVKVFSLGGAAALTFLSFSSSYRQDLNQFYHSNTEFMSVALSPNRTSEPAASKLENKSHTPKQHHHGTTSDRATLSSNNDAIPLHPPICNDPPNIGDPDVDTLKYNVLRRLQHYRNSTAVSKAQEPTPDLRILCVLPFFSPEVEKAALETYVQECNGALVLRQVSNRSAVATNVTTRNLKSLFNDSQSTQVDFLHLDIQSAHWQSELVRYFETNPKQYTWVLWTSPDRYPIIAFMRYALQKHKKVRGPAMLETWLLRHPWDFKYPYGIKKHKKDCAIARLWNWDSSKQILPTCNITRHARVNSSSLVRDPNTTHVVECPSNATSQMKCLEIETPSSPNWLIVLFRYHEYFLSRPWRQMERVHAILNGVCDTYWDRERGALDADGNPGYVHDPFYLRNHPLKFSLHHPDNGEGGVCGLPLGKGDEGENGAKGLLKIQTNEMVANNSNRKKVLCMVYTYADKHDQLSSVAETWGPRCDGFLAASTATNVSLGAVNLLHEGVEEYGNMWMKVVSMFRYAHKHYLDDFDFFHIGGDDMYVIAENLRHTVSTGNWKGPWDQEKPLFLGGSLGTTRRKRFCGGGSGYTLNTVALKLLVEELMATPNCRPHYHGSQEDMFISNCFQQVGLQCADTNDESFEARYHPMPVDYHSAWTRKKPMPGGGWKMLQSKYHNITYMEGLGQISKTSVSFHLKTKHQVHNDVGMRRHHAILYGLCPSDSPLGKSMAEAAAEAARNATSLR